MPNRLFVDSNIWVYLFSAEDSLKQQRAKQYLATHENTDTLIISYQVINEVSKVLLNKGFIEEDIRELIQYLIKTCIVQDYSKDIVLLASNLRERYSFSFWDSQISASAVTAQCGLLISEDMQDGLNVDGTVIRNIFKD